MIGEMIKEYLVGLGVKIDKPGFAEFDSTVNKTTNTISKATGGWGKDFITASGLIATAIAGVTSAAAGLMTSVAKQDLAMDKYARNMMISKSAAVEMKQAIDALGESVQDIQLNPELFIRYKALISDGRNMKIGGDYSQTMKDFRGLIFEFTRLKQEAGYALQWVGYYLMKHLSKPLAEGKEKFKNINDSIIKNMSVWTEKIARTMVYIINIGRSFWSFIKAIGKSVYELWDAFPRGIKIATAALTGFFMLLKATPMGRMIALVSTLFLLIDDYFGHMEGRQAAFGEFWDKLNEHIETVGAGFKELLDICVEWLESIGGSSEFSEFTEKAKELGEAIYTLAFKAMAALKSIFKSLLDSFKEHKILEKLLNAFSMLGDELIFFINLLGDLFDWIAKSDVVKALVSAFTWLLGVFIQLIPVIVNLLLFGKVLKFIKGLRVVLQLLGRIFGSIKNIGLSIVKLFKNIKSGKFFKDFWLSVHKVMLKLKDVVLDAVKSVGKLGRALLELVKGNFKIAVALATEALDGKVEAGERKKDATPTEKEMWELAKQVSQKTGIKPEFVYAQWYHESGHFNSRLAKENYNFGGLTQVTPNGEDNKQPDGKNYYMEFGSLQEWAAKYASFINDYDGLDKAETPEEFAAKLREQGYYTANYSEYVSGLRNGLENIPAEPVKENTNTNPADNEFTIANPSPYTREPTWWDWVMEKNKALWDKITGGSKSASLSIDPAIINGFIGKQYASIGNTTGGFTVVNHVSVGGVTVSGSNLNPNDVGNAVAAKTTSSLEQRSQYVLQNRTLTGGSTWT